MRPAAIFLFFLLTAASARSAALEPDSVFPAEYLAAMEAMERGEARRAFPAFVELVQKNPLFHPAFKSLALCAWKAGGEEVAAAERLFAGLRGKPGAEGANALMGLALLEKGFGANDKALSLLEQSFRRHPKGIAAPLEAAYVFQDMFQKAESPEARQALRRRASDYFTALERKVPAGESGGGVFLARAVMEWNGGRLDEAARLAETARARQEAMGERRGEAVCRFWTAVFMDEAGRFRDASALYEQAASFFEAQGDSWNAAEAFRRLALTRGFLMEAGAAEAAMRRCLALCPEGRRTYALIQNGILMQRNGDYARALGAFEEARAAARQTGDASGAASALANQANVWSALGQPERAVHLMNEAAKSFFSMGQNSAAASAVLNLGVMQRQSGRLENAEASCRRAEEMFERMGDGGGVMLARLNRAELVRRGGRHEEASALLRRASQEAEALGDMRAAAHARHGLAQCLSAMGRHEEALAEAEAALALSRRGGMRENVHLCEHAAASALAGLGRRSEAKPRFRRALRELESLRGGLADGAQREGYLSRRTEVYEDFAALLLESGEEREPSPAAHVFFYPEIIVSREDREEAFTVSERLKARSLLEQMADARLLAAGLAPKDAARLRELQARLVWLRGKTD